jgi:transposase-like protein
LVEAHIEETLTFYRLPRQHHKLLEPLNDEIKRRTLRGADLPQMPEAACA